MADNRWQGASDFQQWQVKALQADYPKCETCQQPIQKVLWGKSKYCRACKDDRQRYGW